jgi:hypothetical protein
VAWVEQRFPLVFEERTSFNVDCRTRHTAHEATVNDWYSFASCVLARGYVGLLRLGLRRWACKRIITPGRLEISCVHFSLNHVRVLFDECTVTPLTLDNIVQLRYSVNVYRTE